MYLQVTGLCVRWVDWQNDTLNIDFSKSIVYRVVPIGASSRLTPGIGLEHVCTAPRSPSEPSLSIAHAHTMPSDHRRGDPAALQPQVVWNHCTAPAALQ